MELEVFSSVLSQGLIALLNLMVITALLVTYFSARKSYLAIACAAGLIESMRVLPRIMIFAAPESYYWALLSLCLQFASSYIFLYALLRTRGEVSRNTLLVIGIPLMGFLIALILQLQLGLASSPELWYAYSTPLILVSLLVLLQGWRGRKGFSPGSTILILGSSALLVLRIINPALFGTPEFILISYMETFLFPILLTSLIISEIEFTHKQVANLLADKIQTEKDLQFILDHSLDVILTADEVGLIKSWNLRAEQQFGYSADQTVDKLHIDELFVDNYWHKNVSEAAEFQSQMEHVNGDNFWVRVRMQTIMHSDLTYSIYVLRDITEQERLTERQLELDRELKRVHQLQQSGN